MIVTVELQTLTVAFPVQISRDQTSLGHQNSFANDEQCKLVYDKIHCMLSKLS